MNRVIKFRAWIDDVKTILDGVNVYNDGSIGISVDKIPQEFYKLYHIDWDDSSIRENGTYNHVMNILTGDEYVWFEEGNFNLMQFTGLHDKNGKEIYDGHVIAMFGGSQLSQVWFCEKWGMWQCVAQISGGINPSEHLLSNLLSTSEVVGNIYSNPELLKS